MMAAPGGRVYMLKARNAPGCMSVRGTGPAPYIIAFEKREHAAHVQKFAHDHTKIEICRYFPEKIDRNTIGDVSGRININKKPNINKLGCDILTCDLLEFMSYPREKNLGIILAYEFIREDSESVIFQGEILCSNKV